jgi:prepilin-type N-terminal cleavage/methylation domain-containing protein
MSIRARGSKWRAFTLIEVMIATLIISLLAFTLFRFISANLMAIRVSTEVHDERESVQAIVRFVQAQLADLPRREGGSLLGKPLKLHDLASDELTWLARAGQGVMTTAAPGEYRVTLTVQPVEKDSSELELGLRREPYTKEARGDVDFLTRGSGANKYNWLPLIRPMAAFEVRYFDPRMNAWLDRWTDQTARPQLVRIRLWKKQDDPPVEAVIPVPSALVQR